MGSTTDQTSKAPRMYTTRSVSGRGQGMFADKEIKAGVRILADEMLFSVTDTTINDGIGERISASLEGLPQEQQQQFEALYCPYYPTRMSLVRRYLSNCFGLGDAQTGIFLKAARINSSCCPNAYFSWNRDLRRITLHAMVDIPAAREITVCYCLPYCRQEHRQEVFQDFYGFQCDCPVCQLGTPTGQRSELRRQRMETLYQAVDKLDGGPSANDQKKLDMVLEFIELAKADRVDGLFLSGMYRRAKEYYEDRGLEEVALEYAKMQVETDRRLAGEDHPDTKQSTKALLELTVKLALPAIQHVE